MRCVTDILNRWGQGNQWQNLGPSPIKSQVEEDESKPSTLKIQCRIQTTVFSVHWTLGVGRWTFSSCRLNSSNSFGKQFAPVARNRSPGSCDRRFIIPSTDTIRLTGARLAAVEITSQM